MRFMSCDRFGAEQHFHHAEAIGAVELHRSSVSATCALDSDPSCSSSSLATVSISALVLAMRRPFAAYFAVWALRSRFICSTSERTSVRSPCLSSSAEDSSQEPPGVAPGGSGCRAAQRGRRQQPDHSTEICRCASHTGLH